MELGTHAFFQWSRRWGKHQYKNRLFLGPQYLGSVNASDSCEDDTLGYCWAAAPLQRGGGHSGIPSPALPLRNCQCASDGKIFTLGIDLSSRKSTT